MTYVAPRAETEHATQKEAGDAVGKHLHEAKTTMDSSREWPLPAGSFYDNRWITTTSSTTTTSTSTTSTSSTSVTSTTTSTSTSTSSSTASTTSSTSSTASTTAP